MQNTTSSTLESITPAVLADVSGGCRNRRGCGCSSSIIQAPMIIQMPQLAQAPLAQPAQPAPSGDTVSTSVNIGGQAQV